jgi:hypothetical protein
MSFQLDKLVDPAKYFKDGVLWSLVEEQIAVTIPDTSILFCASTSSVERVRQWTALVDHQFRAFVKANGNPFGEEVFILEVARCVVQPIEVGAAFVSAEGS